ncbi:hypothetical protein [Chamaesiphon minutus]|uniref:Uncharacterized protein n=1 Tax=Chamaesiphon minutus (strain ATCC 27169 / PCC 6605) TaxID=1173020 RepID=K9UB67_CHAP6|nr:hypothetical protein [Chamaesiphon minutus]AFY92327.1 hypothetical protein Cha6605_1097 [Chamaesiphon minutus PCC 6605]
MLDRAKKIAKQKGLTVREYLTNLMDGDEEDDEMESLTPLELSDPDVKILDDLDVKFAALPTRIFIARQAMHHLIVDKISDRILGILGEIYVWMKGGTTWSLY